MVDPEIAAWALARIKQSPQQSAQLAECGRRFNQCYGELPASERVLRAEPISTVIGLTALIEGAFGATVLGVSAGAIGGAIIGVGLSIGLNYALSALKSNGAAQLSNNVASSVLTPQSIQITERQAIPSKRIIYGSALVSGALFFEAVKPPYLYQGLLLCAKPVTGFRQVQIGTVPISFASLLPNTLLTPIAITGQPDYPGHLLASLRLGAASQAMDLLLDADFPNLDASFRQQGIATAVMRYHYGSDFTQFTALWGQVSRPNPLFLIDGIAVPDPRIPGHVLDWDPDDATSVAAAEASWSFSNNAALVQTHYLTQRYGGRIRPDRINWDKVAAAADWDGTPVVCNDGTLIPRYTIDGVVTLDEQPSDVLAAMLSANRGFVLESAGQTWVSSSLPRTPVATVHDGILTGALAYQASKAKRDLVNRIRTQFVATDREYQTVVGPVLARPDLVTADGELLEATLDLPFTLDSRRAQRLAKAFLATARLGATITCSCDVALLANCSDELIGNTVNFSSTLFSQMNGVYFVSRWGFSDGFASVNLILSEYDPAIETDWNAAVDEQPFVLAPLNVS